MKFPRGIPTTRALLPGADCSMMASTVMAISSTLLSRIKRHISHWAAGYGRANDGALDSNGHFAKYPKLDIELTRGWENQRNCIGWTYQGMATAGAEVGCPIVPITYGQWTFETGPFDNSTIDSTTGMPQYLLPSHDCLWSNDPTLQVCNDAGGVVSMDQYPRAIWGKEPFYKRDANGSLTLSDGQPIFNDISQTICYGATLTLQSARPSTVCGISIPVPLRCT